MAFNPAKLRVWHTQLMDALILNPRASNTDLAAMFGTSKEYISALVSADLFRAQLEERRKERAAMVDQTVVQRLQEKVSVLAEATVERLTDAVVTGDMTLEGVRETADMALRAIGYGAPAARPAPVVQNTVVVLDRDMLAAAREKMRGVSGPTLDALPAPSAA